VKLLIVKMSSLGDVIHALPAITDIALHCPDAEIHWVVEEAFAAIPDMHPSVSSTIPTALRRWRSRLLNAGTWREASRFLKVLRQQQYDLVIDAQGLIKSALIGGLARGSMAGFDAGSARERLASYSYGTGYAVERNLHAVDRQRRLFGAILGFSPDGPADYGLQVAPDAALRARPTVMLLHGTTWASKHWPESCWIELARILSGQGIRVAVPAGNLPERARARRIIDASGDGMMLEGLGLGTLASCLAGCVAAVTVDSGLGHLAAAVRTPLVSLFGPTDPDLTGIRPAGATPHQLLVSDHLPCIPCRKRTCQFSRDSSRIYPPCFEPITPETIWQALRTQIEGSGG
jgi:heptosyltransferase-1